MKSISRKKMSRLALTALGFLLLPLLMVRNAANTQKQPAYGYTIDQHDRLLRLQLFDTSVTCVDIAPVRCGGQIVVGEKLLAGLDGDREVMMIVNTADRADLYRLNLETGVANRIGATGLRAIAGVAMQPTTRRLIGLDPDHHRFVQIDTASARTRTLAYCALPLSAMVFDPDDARKVLALDISGKLWRIDPDNSARKSLGGKLFPKSRVLTADASGRLYVARGRFLHNLNLSAPSLVSQVQTPLDGFRSLFFSAPDHQAGLHIRCFQLATAGAQIAVEWQTDFENDLLGFDVLRRAGDVGVFNKVNGDLIYSRGGQTQPVTYRFVDPTAEPGVPYQYLLRSSDFKGEHSLHGPVAVAPPRFSAQNTATTMP